MMLFLIADVFAARRRELDQQCYQTFHRAFCPGTVKNHRSHCNLYKKFCAFYGLRVIPIDALQLVRFARYLANLATSYSTVTNYLSTIKKLHVFAGLDPEQLKSPELELFMRGLKMELALPVKQSKPVTPYLLLKIYQQVNLRDVFEIVAYTAILVGFYLFLRSNNLVPESVLKFQPGRQLTRAHISQWNGVTLVHIEWSKTIQYRQKTLYLPLIPVERTQICPVFWLKKLCELIPAKESDPLFALPKDGGLVPLTYDQLRKQFATWVESTGRSPGEITLHGLRRGGASFAMQAGLVGEQIKLMGDWASDAYLTYIDLDIDKRVRNMVQFMTQVDKVMY